MRMGSITTDIVSDGLTYNLDPGNRASTQPITAVPNLFNTIKYFLCKRR